MGRQQQRQKKRHPRRAAAAAGLLLCLATPGISWGAPVPRLEVTLEPEHLGQGTTINFGFRITESHGAAPPPVTQIALYYPANFDIITSDLGTASCTALVLELAGPIACPSQSLMGYGTATGELQVGEELVEESATTTVFMAPFQNGDIALQFFLHAKTPLSVERIFPGLLLPAPTPYGGALTIIVPLIGTFTEGPDVALVRLHSTIGPLGITYYDHIHHTFVPYHPNGIVLPRHCPRGGFPFAAKFTFAEGTTTTARRSVPCPPDTPTRRAMRVG